MTYGYSYKTSDGIRHESTFEAKSNEAVFAALRAQGIKPMKVWEIHSPYYISKRTRLIIILALALAASLVYTIRLRHSALSTQHSPHHAIRSTATPRFGRTSSETTSRQFSRVAVIASSLSTRSPAER